MVSSGADANPYQLATVFTSETASMGIHFQSSSTIGMNPNLKTGEDVIYRSWFRGGFWDNRLYSDFTLL